MRITCVLASTTLALTLAASITAQDRFETLPGYDRYKLVTDSMKELVTGGRISRINWNDERSMLEFVRDDVKYELDLETFELSELQVVEDSENDPSTRRRTRGSGRGRQRDHETSPDEAYIARCVDWNVVIDRADDDDRQRIAVTTDGTRKRRFGKASWVYGEELSQNSAMWWSPDSTKLAFYELDETDVKDFYLTTKLTQWRTELAKEGYPKAGEPNPIAKLWIYDVPSGELTAIQIGDDREQYVYQVRFSPDGSQLLFNRTNRHQNVLELVAADVETGISRVVVTETQRTWQRNRPYIKFLDDGQRFIWQTEKTGWLQYELRNLTGSLVCSLTRGDYPAGEVLDVDEDAGVMYYMAYSDDHPLNAQLHRVGLDGNGQTRLTSEPMNHRVRLSPDHKYFITTYETAEIPPTTALYSIEGEWLATLGESNASRLDEFGLTAPELFMCKADDGVTDLYGLLYKPSNFDPLRTYPLIIDVYGGPQSQRVRNRFRAANAYCEFGYLIAVIDNRGTRGRGKAFEEAIYMNLGIVDLADQVAAVRFLTQRPYIDAERVGIFGHSYGGYMSALAIVKHPDVFHVAVASSPVTDWRNYDTIYTERYMRTPAENPDGYDQGSCLTFADQLTGKLLLMHGMVDDNVHPSNSWQLVDKLQQAGKSFSMMFFPNYAHGIRGPANAIRWEFLYDHLVGNRTSPSSAGESAPAEAD
ncbi:MAG: S9 family peptidase [Planctomycetes bacterium]|nr:S9 family peptidase [Planctomycetota bacterium]